MKLALPLVASCALVLAACSGEEPKVAAVAPSASSSASPSPAATTSTTEAAEPLSKDDILQFAETAWVDEDYEAAKEYVVPGLPADRYLDFQIAAGKAYAAAGSSSPVEETSVEWEDDVLVMKQGTGKGAEYKLKNFEGADGLVSTWTQRNFEIGSHLMKAPVSKKGPIVDVDVLGAWENQNGLFVVMDVEAHRSVQLGYGSSYDDADGRTTDAGEVRSPETLKKGKRSYVMVVFEKAKLGGVASLKFTDPKSYEKVATVKIPVR